jgi:hypothetical protein
VQTENEKAVRTLFEEWLAETQYAQDSESFHNELYSAWKSGRQSAERSQAALQSQVSNTPQDGPNIQSLNICPRNSGHPHMFSKPGTIDSCRHCGLSEREWKVKAEAKLLAAQTPQQQEQSGEVVTPYSLQTVVSFLCGEGPMDGVWFGDTNPRERGKYWWRKYLRAATSSATPTATASQESAPEQEAVAKVRTPICSDNDFHCTFPECSCNRG